MFTLSTFFLVLASCVGHYAVQDTSRNLNGDQDEDGYSTSEDCDDNDADINPGAEEICDGIDNDCDGDIDEGCPP